MLLQQILHELDAEIVRLETLRNLVYSLQGSSLDAVLPLTEPAGLPVAAPSPPPALQQESPEQKPKRSTRARRQTGSVHQVRRRSKTAPEAAFAKLIPNGPVVVTRADLLKEREAKSARKPEAHPIESLPEPGSLGAMIRSMELRSSNPS